MGLQSTVEYHIINKEDVQAWAEAYPKFDYKGLSEDLHIMRCRDTLVAYRVRPGTVIQLVATLPAGRAEHADTVDLLTTEMHVWGCSAYLTGD